MLAALLLAITSFLSLSGNSEDQVRDPNDGSSTVVQYASGQDSADDDAASKRKLSISLLLFRNG